MQYLIDINLKQALKRRIYESHKSVGKLKATT